MINGGKTHRASKTERAEVLKVLKGIWEKGYLEGITLSYLAGEEEECRKVFFALGDYRKKINKQKLAEYEIYLKIQSTILQKVDDLTIRLSRKPSRVTRTSEAILNTVNRFPELGLAKKEFDNPVHTIAANVFDRAGIYKE